MLMPDKTTIDETTEDTTRELPEAFTQPVNKADQKLKQISPEPTQKTSGRDRVTEGSEESFPASDPPSAGSPTAIPKTPADPTDQR